MDAGLSETRRLAVLEAVVMASLSPGDRSEQSTNGTIKGLRNGSIGAAGWVGDEQTLVDTEQTLADSDQTLADSDQTSGERDQSSADSDQAASDRDQAASDRELARGVDPLEHEASRDVRRRTAREREQTAGARLESAEQRDMTAQARDVAALARDRAGAARDQAMAQRDADYSCDDGRAMTGAEIVMRAAEQRRRAVEYRLQAAEYRAQAARDRQAAAADRVRGARDRLRALADREALARALALTEIDPLTGARVRAAGLADLGREIDRSRRSGSTLVVVYVDLVGLKRLNDSEGHDAGDRLLQRLVVLISEHLRPYDLIARLGGDEFLCAMSNMTQAEAHQRFSAIAGALATSSEAGALRTGFAELRPSDSATEIIARADAQLNDSRRDTDPPRATR
jgi:diguanylate cyclase (GGDEF)-like protein